MPADEGPADDPEEAAHETAVPDEAGAAEGRPPEVALDEGVVLNQVVDAGDDEAAHAGRDDEFVGELGRHAAAADERPHEGEARHDERQRGHEAEAVQAEVADLEEDGAHRVGPV
jgi:hypothetical protein